MIQVKVLIEFSNGCDCDENIVTISADNWRNDEAFIKLIKELDTKAKSLTHSWNTDGNEDCAYVSLEYVDVKDSRVCYILNDLIQDFLSK